jgi:hypothetical protein
MIANFLFYAALVAMIWVAASNLTAEKVAQLPFVMSASFLAMVMPQLWGLMHDDSSLAAFYRRNGTTLLLCFTIFTCYLGALLGYRLALKRGTVKPAPETQKSVTVIYRAGLVIGTVLLVVSMGSTYLLSRLGGGFDEFFNQAGAYKIVWSGLPVYLGMFVRLNYPALFFILMVNSIRGTLFTRLLLLGAVLYPLAQIFLLNRRSDVVFLFFAILIALPAFYRIKVPRIAVVAGVVFGVLLILLQPALRAQNQTTNPQFAPRGGVDVMDVVEDTTNFDPTKEIAAAAYAINRAWTQGAFQYGAVLWDAQVNQWVPAGLVGPEIKEKLRIFRRSRDVSDSTGLWSRSRYFYIAQFGFSDAFQQFGFLAGGLFFAIGYVFGRWQSRRHETLTFYYLLTVYSPYLALAVGHGITPMIVRWPIDLTIILSFGLLLRYFARREARAPRLVPGYAA